MLFKILREYLRRIARNYKIYAVSILGMSVAIIATFHIYHFVYKELSVDKFHEKREDIYRLVNNYDNTNTKSTTTFLPIGPILKDKIPEVKDFARITTYEEPHKLKTDTGIEKKVSPRFTDSSFFDLFNFDLQQGSLQTFSDTPNGIIISEKIANSLFGNESPIGKQITISKYRNESKWLLEVVGVLKTLPEVSTIQGDCFINIESLEILVGDRFKNSLWNMLLVELFIHAPDISNINEFTEKVKDLTIDEANLVRNPNYPMKREYFNIEFQRLDKMYFYSTTIREQKNKGSLQFLKIITLVGLLTLLLAITNYIIMNLGLSLTRANEFKIKRYLGTSKKHVFIQLIIESFLNAFVCFLLALITYPLLNRAIALLIGVEYHLTFKDDYLMILSFLLVVLFIGFIIGVFQYLLSYRAVFSESKTQISNSWMTKRLMITFQIFLFIGLIICVSIIKKQVDFIETKDVGFNFHNVIGVFPDKHGEELKDELLSKSYVEKIAGGETLFKTEYQLEDVTIQSNQEKVKTMVVLGDTDYLELYNVELLYGKTLNPSKLQTFYNFKALHRGEELVEVLVNEAFVKRANLKDPIGTPLRVHSNSVIVGVFKNVNNTPLYEPIQPIVIGYNFPFFKNMFQVRFKEGYKNQVMSDIASVFKRNNASFDYFKDFIEYTDYQDIYKKELQLKRLLEAFTVIVLFISLLGLVAISLFITESKTKEIGIRKVNGATINEIMLMLNKDFVKWVGIAFIIACPIAYYAMHKWLENFAYKTALSWWVFALAGLFTLVIALLTVSWQTYRAATSNPVQSLRDE
ncbi:ABC transporter permease [Snuella sedimenti]|uniref:ABC transporter permease n=1 Tax=Snuella sedimenti TaxID=2798802 RepID=A0A8J7IFZ4_9FLAO|nr:ABC transporter permease [Snuella sedimenti]MBJ6368552.1 ABC transporter permease [Snuella sedimenti]